MRFLRDRRAVAAVLFGLAAVPLILAVGIGVDAMRIWLVRSRLITAVDAAALAGGRNLNLPVAQRDAEIRAMFWTNFQRNGVAATAPPHWFGFMGASAPEPTICTQANCGVPDANTLRVSNTAAVPLTFMRLARLVGGPNNDAVTVRWSADARRTDLGMEVALVLDVTGSMGPNNTPSAFGTVNPTNTTKIDALRLAAGDLVNILYGANDTLDNLRVAVVPYTTTVNIGPGRAAWLDPARPSDARYAPRGWQGCVEARHRNGHDQDDATPAAVPFQPFFSQSTLGQYTRRSTGAAVVGDNDWAPSLTGTNGISEMFQDVRSNNHVTGPNVNCPAVPILPLTASRTTVLNTIAQLRATFRGGTMHQIGMQAGWFTLSPAWQGLWGDPVTPRPYATQFLRKVVVLMTDGEVNWFDYPGGAPGACTDQGTSNASSPAGSPPVRPLGCPPPAAYPSDIAVAPGAPPLSAAGHQNADYTGYGRLLENRLGIAAPLTVQRMRNEMDVRLMNICTSMKNSGIVIYTVTFDVPNTGNGPAVQDLFRRCASVPENYFNSPTAATLRTAFQQIGTQLQNLRLLR